MDKEDLERIKKLINEYSQKYNCRIELKESEMTVIGDINKKYTYHLYAYKEETIIV